MHDISLLDWFRDTTVFGVSMSNLVIALAVALLVYLALTFAVRIALARLARVAGRTSTRADDLIVEVLSGTNRTLMALVALLVGVGMLDLPDRWASRVSQLWFVALVLQIALWANRAVTIGLRRYAERHGGSGAQPVSAAATLISWGVRTLLWAIVLLAMLSNMGVNITAFIASLGVGGIAIALAAQNILGDLFASVAIAVDKPFEVGDFIVLGGLAGTVEQVGVKTTRIRSLGGEQIVMSNTELLKQTVSNYKRLRQRRIVFTFRVTYGTTPEQAAQIPEVVKRIVGESERLRFDRAHLKAFGESSLDYEVVYIVLDPDYNLYMDEQQRINLALMRELSAIGVEFAFPTRTVVMSTPREAEAESSSVRPLRPTVPTAVPPR
ncbi:MAG: mechanosensitive ion channel family protein [Rhizobacter sp.]|nr:mechanosensitive ion channel family protein [Rhizobacter sp.]